MGLPLRLSLPSVFSHFPSLPFPPPQNQDSYTAKQVLLPLTHVATSQLLDFGTEPH